MSHIGHFGSLAPRRILDDMRSEHSMTADEHDAFTAWRRVIVRMRRAGVRKALKQKSHRKDRRRAQQHREP